VWIAPKVFVDRSGSDSGKGLSEGTENLERVYADFREKATIVHCGKRVQW
jgi:hypothetical protein